MSQALLLFSCTLKRSRAFYDLVVQNPPPPPPPPLSLSLSLSLPLSLSLTRTVHSQLQSLVARTQCGDLCPVLCSLLKDRASLSRTSSDQSNQTQTQLSSRSIYRETLFLKSVLNNSINTGECEEKILLLIMSKK